MEVTVLIVFMKNHSLENIKHKLLLLYLFNVTDIVFTLLLLATGYYMEANLLMAKAVQNLFVSFMLKVLLPAVLLFYIYIRIKTASEKQLKQSNILLNMATIVYAIINISHLVWFSLYGFFTVFSTQ